MFFGWENIKKAALEWFKTFSNDKSFLSSKRISRFVFSITGLCLSVFVIIYNRTKWGAVDDIIVIGPLFGYAGFELTKTQKEKITNQTNGNDTKKEVS